MSESKISCPHCGLHVLIDDSWAGQTIACPSCQEALVVPGAPAVQVVAPPPAALLVDAPAVRRTSGLAIASLVLSLFGCVGITALAGIICGHAARGRIRRNPELSGSGIALAGLIIGYLMLGLCILLCIPAAIGFKRGWEETQHGHSAQTQIPPATLSQTQLAASGIDTNMVMKSDLPVPDGAVTGKIQGQEFTYSRAGINKFTGTLTVDQGERSHPDQQLKIVPLVRTGGSMENRTWSITPSGAGIKPTVWLTWMENGQSHSEVAQNYSLEIKTELETNGVIAGSLSLSSEGGRVVSLKGNFTAKVE